MNNALDNGPEQKYESDEPPPEIAEPYMKKITISNETVLDVMKKLGEYKIKNNKK
jgi:hypothetical protein